MSWFAHSRKGHPEKTWESQLQHGQAVGKAAAQRAEKFRMGAVGGAEGVLHDLGKYNPQFQDYIRQRATSVDHSTAGAVYARTVYGPVLGSVIAHGIAGHHAGLKDELLAQEGRLARYAPKLSAIVAVAKTDDFAFPPVPAVGAMTIDPEDEGFQRAFLTRMLFSCLIDADRRETARFYDGDIEADYTATLAALTEELSGFMASEAAKREANGEAATEINRLRTRVHNHVVAQANDPQGIFTLTIPTGGGKTLTSLRFALDHARQHELDRVVVVIPFTSVIEQTAQVYRKALGPYANQLLEHHSAFEDEGENKRQGRDKLHLATETWDAPLIVTTAVQFFESLFASKASRCRKLHNLAKSVIVLDEAQTIPLHLLRPCVAALKELTRNYSASVVLCTATQPALEDKPEDKGKRPEERHSFEGGFVAPKELAPDVTSLFEALNRVTIRRIGLQDDAALAARMKASLQVLCIVNSRAHARDLYGKIADLPGAYHLSTLMLPEHRRRMLDEIKAKLKAGEPCRLVSTSLVEAGVDFSFPLVLRAEAGLEQIVQAAGRCNRNGELGEGRFGEVLAFQAEGRKPLASLVANVETAREIMRHHENPQMPEAIRTYFGRLYWRRGNADLDRHGVLARCAGKADTLDFPFETIANSMKLIDDMMEPIIVPLDQAARDAVVALRSVDRPGALARILQRYTVGIPPSARKTLQAAGVADVVRPETFGTQFVVLTNLDLYRPDVGLTWDDPTFIEAGNYIL